MRPADEGVHSHEGGNRAASFSAADDAVTWADLRPAVGWMREHRVLLVAILLIAAQVAWKAQFLSHLYFRQDDFHDLDLALDHRFNWDYLTYIGSGHLIIGLRALAWPLVRLSSNPYNWELASAVSLVFVACAGLAAYRLLRDLFGDRPAILVMLSIYLLTPLTMPDLGIWSSAMESVPLQLATFSAISAHLRYVRSRRTRHLLAAAFWVGFGMLFFEKGMVVPLLLFGITAAFLTDARTLLAGGFRALVSYWKAWAAYSILVLGYLAILLRALHTSASQPKVPVSASGVSTFVGELVRDTFLPGTIGGPWAWFPAPGNSYSFAAPPPGMVVISVVVAVAVVVVSVMLRAVAWRAWLILVGWLAVADVLPVVIGRLNAFNPSVLGLETRYVADATPVLVVCIGLAFLPVVKDMRGPVQPRRRRAQLVQPQTLRSAAATIFALFVFGSVWSVQSYEDVTNGKLAANYIANARAALKAAPKGTLVVQRPAPQNILEGTFEAYAYTSKLIGYMERGKLQRKLRWLVRPNGTVDGLMAFGDDGRLHQAEVFGTTIRPTTRRKCFQERQGRIIVRFPEPSPAFSGTLRMGYYWYAHIGGTVYVRYGGSVLPLAVLPGLHSGYLPVRGTANGIVVEGLGGSKMCVGDVEAGNLGPSALGPVIPAPR